MAIRENPFTPSFGSVPPFMAGRDELVQEILDGLDNGPGDPHRATIFIGARGSGKTALLAYIADAQQMMTDASGGFPFLIQLIGYHVWRQHPEIQTITLKDATSGIEYGRAVMEEMVIKSTLRELTEKDIRFLKAMVEDQEVSHISDIAKRLGITANAANQTRRHLIDSGIVGGRGRGKLGFELPMLKEYLHMQG